MHTIEDIRREYDRLDTLCGVDTTGIEIVLSKRMVKRLGCFRFPRIPDGNPPRIAISALLLEEDGLFWDTVRHEYAHALVWLRRPGETHGHDALWQAACREVGCRPEATSAAPELASARRQKARYRVRCKTCGHDSFYLRRGRVIDLLLSGRGHVRCNLCGGTDFQVSAP